MFQAGQGLGMVVSRGGITGGFSIADALKEFERRGYVGQFAVRPGGHVECVACGCQHEPEKVPLSAMRRVEGVSDPADMVFVGALECTCCGQRGTATLKYGALAQPEEAQVLRHLDNRRASTALTHRREDASLVRDTGWQELPF